jgi:alpha 1,6-mannosyltransferase
MQWTIASAPAHPILLDALRRIHLTTKNLQAYASKHNKTLAQVRDELDATSKEGTYLSVMEFTGPGVWTDSVMRYLKIQFGLDWNFWKERVHPGRVRELVMLPVTGLSFYLSQSDSGGC